MKINIKNILFSLILIFTSFVFNIESSNAICFLFDGTYIGAAIVTTSSEKKESRPLFIVVANQHITGFFAPEDQIAHGHGPGGSSFNLGDLTASSTYTLSLTTDNNILIKSTDGKINGKAKLGSIEDGSPSFSGFYNADVAGDFLPGDFLNIGSDGGAILKFAGSDGKIIHAFGKIDASGKFIQVFPEKGKGPHVSISFDGTTADIEATLNGDSFITTLRKFVSTSSCNSTSSSSSSSGAASSSKPALVTTFQSALNSLSSLSTTKSLIGAKAEVKDLQNAVRLVKYTLLNLPTSDCNNQLAKRVANLSSAVDTAKKAATCGSSCFGVLLALDDDNLIIKDKSTIDENGNGIVDICEQYSQFSGEEPISIAPDLKDLLNSINNTSRLLRKDAKNTFSVPTLIEVEPLFDKLSKLLKAIRTSLRLPDSICSLRLKGVSKVYDAVINIKSIVCSGSGTEIEGCKEKTDNLIEDADLVDALIKLDANKNDIADVCE